MNYRNIAIRVFAVGAAGIAISIAKATSAPLGIFAVPAVVVDGMNEPAVLARSMHAMMAKDSIPLLTTDLLQRWIELHRVFFEFPDSIRSSVPAQYVRYREVAPELGNDSTTFKNWAAIAAKTPLVATAFANAKIPVADYAPIAAQIVAARAIIKWRNLALDSTKTSAPPPTEAALKSLTPIERAIAVILPQWFVSAKPNNPDHIEVPESSESVGSAAPSLLVEEWLNANGSLALKSDSLTFNDGKVYLIGFTASWCSACPYTYEPFARLAAEYSSRGVQVMYVSPRFPSTPELKKYVEKHKITVPVAVQGEGQMSGNAPRYNVTALPAAFLIDGKGIVRHRWPSGTTDTAAYRRVLSKAIDSLLKNN